MKLKVKIWHAVLFICFMIIAIRFLLLLEIFEMNFHFLIYLINHPAGALSSLNIETTDYIISSVLIILIPLIVFFARGRSLLTAGINFSSVVIILMLSFLLFAPLIAGIHPDFQKDLKITKLLPPLSSVMYLELRQENKEVESTFIEKRNEITDRVLYSAIIFVDSINLADSILCFQNDKIVRIDRENVLFSGGLPVTGSRIFLMGTDEYGRDILSRIVYGARVTLIVGLGAVIITLLLGVSLGFIAGYSGGLIDIAFSRITDMFMAFPIIFLIILILALFGNSILIVILVLGYSGWMSLFKIVRSEVIMLKQKDFFIAARLAGLSKSSLLIKEIFPIILAPVIVNLVFQYGNVILAESALNYLGLGTSNVYPSWGGMIESGQEYINDAWWMIFFPGFFLFITLYTANNIGRQINLHFNPRLKR